MMYKNLLICRQIGLLWRGLISFCIHRCFSLNSNLSFTMNAELQYESISISSERELKQPWCTKKCFLPNHFEVKGARIEVTLNDVAARKITNNALGLIVALCSLFNQYFNFIHGK